MREPRGTHRAAAAAIGLAVVLLLAAAEPSSADRPRRGRHQPKPPAPQQQPAPAPPPPTWDLKLGLSYLATAGNTDNSSAGIDTSYHQEWDLWSVEASGSAVRATRNDRETAENASCQVRGRRKISDGLEATAGLRGETNRFAGVDLRTVADTSLSWKAWDTGGWRVRTLWGLSWTREDPLGDRPVRDSLGGLLQLQNTVKISEASELNGQVTAWPNLEDAEDYRVNAVLALQAALNRHLALRLGYDVKYDNEPISGFEKVDTTSTASLVVQLGRAARH